MNVLKFLKKPVVLLTINFIIIALLLIGFIVFKNMYEKAPGEVWILEGSNEKFAIDNILFSASNNYKKQIFSGATLTVLDENIINEAEKISIDMCYRDNKKCVFNSSIKGQGNKILVTNNPLIIAGRNSTAFDSGFIFDENGKLPKTFLEFEKILKSMYAKITITTSNEEKVYELELDAIHKLNQRGKYYDMPYGDPEN